VKQVKQMIAARRVHPMTVAAGMFAIAISPACLADLPQVQGGKVRPAFHNGEHNAFTDLVVLKGTFGRRPSLHRESVFIQIG